MLELVIGYKVFDLIVVITSGGPGFATTLAPYVIYQTGLRGSFDMGTAAAQTLVFAAVVITVNWATYIYGVNSGHVVETSLGYFINPLVSVLLGVVVFAERLRRLQWVAVGIAAVAVGVLTVDYGRPPWIALALAVTFGLYGLMKKLVRVAAAPGLFVETALVAVPAAADAARCRRRSATIADTSSS